MSDFNDGGVWRVDYDGNSVNITGIQDQTSTRPNALGSVLGGDGAYIFTRRRDRDRVDIDFAVKIGSAAAEIFSDMSDKNALGAFTFTQDVEVTGSIVEQRKTRRTFVFSGKVINDTDNPMGNIANDEASTTVTFTVGLVQISKASTRL